MTAARDERRVADDAHLNKAMRLVLNLLGDAQVPTDVDVDRAIETAIAALIAMGDPAVDRHALRRLVQANVHVFVGEGEVLEGKEDHVPWLEPRLSEIERWQFWDAYREWSARRLPRDV